MIKVIFFIWSTLFADKNIQCLCAPTSFEAGVKKSNIILAGKILKIDTLKITDEYIPKDAFQIHYLATVKTNKVYKGKNIQDTTCIITGDGVADCGYLFENNKDYVFYANEEIYTIVDSLEVMGSKFQSHKMKYFATSICYRTTTSTKAEEKLLNFFFEVKKLKSLITAYNKRFAASGAEEPSTVN